MHHKLQTSNRIMCPPLYKKTILHVSSFDLLIISSNAVGYSLILFHKTFCRFITEVTQPQMV